jgi:hypothetical protein
MGTAPGRLPSAGPSRATEHGPEHVRPKSRCSGPGDSSGLAMGRVVRPQCCRGALGDASPSYCHLHFDHEFGPPPFCGVPTLVDPKDAAKSPRPRRLPQGGRRVPRVPAPRLRAALRQACRTRPPARLGCSRRRGQAGACRRHVRRRSGPVGGLPQEAEVMARAVWNGTVTAESDATAEVEGKQSFTPDAVERGTSASRGRIPSAPGSGPRATTTSLSTARSTRTRPGTTRRLAMPRPRSASTSPSGAG